jgi:hypothetical protein
VVDGHQTLHELIECGAILQYDAADPKMLVPDSIGQQDCAKFFQVVDHGLVSCVDEIPAQGRTGHDENEAEKHHKLYA